MPVPPDALSAVRFEDVTRHFAAVKAVDGVSFEIANGEFFSMLGPSGSGKTTCLRLIAGFEQPTGGRILLEGRDVTGVPPYDRDINTVFQDYALFPHMRIWENVAYGLMVRGVPKAERRRQAGEMLEMVRLSGLGERRPSELSGGQRQRVALARALVNRPAVLLLDEPLGALDLKLREAMQEELKALQRQVGITFIYVTHDQGEALSMSDRVAVFNQGRIEQIGTPAEIYDRPRTAFVAGFVGASNMIDETLAARLVGSARPFALRPERIRMISLAPDADHDHAAGIVATVSFLGAATRYRVALEGGGHIEVSVPYGGGASAKVGDAVVVAWPTAARLYLDGAEVG
ncbi:ABC transporter ATP-binding protein [Segnochrobactrum spirostomi]|uniref:ABC transporter ATP-binding protein n=1 Tax=Segnochrobactrum spirostomi TaxID=2608987 RepID=A0A6A7Y260_9HYPH|nr:ABC transporter ATP-binding protein [Segnochrobactrum spirostomi]MQT13103.1 ABC transporter ATP-binding protein [Segnochrobactrum spirostomi]